MKDVPEIHSIRTLHARGFSKRRIAALLKVSRKTVDKYTAEDYIVDPAPRMRLTKERPSPKMDPWKPVIDQWLAEDETRPRKQRRTARKMYRDLASIFNADVSEATVRRYVRSRKQERARQAYVPLEFPMGSMAEVDFGHALVSIDDVERTLPFFAMRLMASGVSFVKVYPHAKLEAMLDGIASGLAFLGGVPRQLMFDNDSTIVREILGGGLRVQTPEFKALAAHYGFEPVFANPGAGNEKGGVESLVKWAQRNLFSPVPRAASLDELNRKLLAECLADSQTRRRGRGERLVADLWEEEQAHLATLPASVFPACRNRFVRVDKTLLVTYDRAVYSVPPAYARKSLLLRAFWDRIEITDRERTVAIHPRQEPGGCSMHLEHYLPVLAHKPRAVAHAAVIARGEPAIARYRDHFLAARPGAYRELVAVLRLAETVGVRRLAAALETASRYRTFDLESVRSILAMAVPGENLLPTDLDQRHLGRWPETPVPEVAAGAYAWLDEVAVGRDCR
ncbi:MAG: IS21 family transposase [Bacillota bacterium]